MYRMEVSFTVLVTNDFIVANIASNKGLIVAG
jgi:rRNA maturation endonuclease Nob1